MSVRTDTVNLIVNVNGNQAQNNLNNLRKRAVDLTAEMKGLRKGTEEWIAKSKELKKVEADMASLKKQIGITSLTQKELVAELRKLQAMKGSVAPFSKEFNDLDKQIKAVNSRLYDVRNGVQGFSSFLSKIKTEVKQFGVLAMSYLGFQFLTSQVKNIVSGAGKLSDSLADIRRVAGMTQEEVESLNSSLGDLNTRSSVTSLREIAVVAGKLGVEKDSIAGFTQELDKLVVSLGDELGDANTIAETLGKIVTVFDGDISGDNIGRLGNAFVNLANSGAASAAFIADFDQRLSGIAKSANIGLGALSGLGAGLEEMGGRVESSATAVQKIITSVASDLPKAAKIAGKDIQEFSQTFATNAEEALLQYAEGLVKNKNSFAELVAEFKNAGEDGARVIETLSKMGQSADYLRGRIDAGKTSIQEMSDINEAFALKNETFGATLDKLGKKAYSLVTSAPVLAFAKGIVNGISAIIDALMALPKWIEKNATTLKILTGALVVLNLERVKTIGLIALDTLTTKANIVQKALATTATNGLAAAMRSLNLVMKGNVFGLLITAVTAAIALADRLKKKTEEVTEELAKRRRQEEMLNQVMESSRKTYSDAIAEMQMYRERINDTNTTLDEKKKALDELIRINPEFAKTLSISKDGHLQGAQAIDVYINALNRKAIAEAAEAKLKDIYKGRLDSQIEATNKIAEADKKSAAQLQQLDKYYEKLPHSAAKYRKAQEDAINRQRVATKAAAVQEQKNRNSETDGAITTLNQVIRTQGDVSGVPVPGGSGGGGSVPTGTNTSNKSGGSGRGGDNKAEQLKRDIENFQKEIAQLQREGELRDMEANEAEIERVKDKYAALITRAKEYALDTIGIENLRQRELDALTKKQQEEADAKAYSDALNANADLIADRKLQSDKAFADGLINKEQHEAELQAIEIQGQEARYQIALTYKDKVKTAGEDAADEHRKAEEMKTSATIAENEKRKKFADDEKLAKAKTGVLSSVKGTDAELAAKKNLLQVQFELETENMDRTSEMYQMKLAERNAGMQELDKEHTIATLQNWLDVAKSIGDVFDGINALLNAKAEKQLAKEKKVNDERKKSYKKQLDSKLISQAQYDKLVEEADAEMQEKEKAAARERAKRERAAKLYMGVINTASAVLQALASAPPPYSFILAAAAAIAGGLQVANIANAPLPELGTGDWIRKGDKHNDRSRGIPAMIERDEAVISANAMTDEDVITVTGTTAQITSALNARKGGKAWAAGARIINAAAWMNGQPKMIDPQMPLLMTGGRPNSPLTPEGGTAALQVVDNSELLRQIISAQRENTEEIRNMKTKLHAVVSIKEYREKEQLYDNAKKVSGI